MIGQIAKKEIQYNSYSIRLPALMVISAILFILNAMLAVTEPVREIPAPRRSTISTSATRKHNSLQFCLRDTGADRTREVRIWIGGNIQPQARDQYVRKQLPVGDYLEGYALPYFERIDWVFIIRLVFSLFAIIFTFDSVCGEREQGTLSLMCANSVSRSSILIGKYLGACGTLLIPLIVGVTINLLILVSGIAGTVPLQVEHWLRIGLIFLTSVVYISIFVFLGLLISIAVRRSSSALLILLAFWVALVTVHPNLSVVAAKSISRIETRYQLRQQIQAVEMEGRDELRQQLDSGKIKSQEEFSRMAEEILSRKAERINKMESGHRQALVKRHRLMRRISMISPASIYQYLGESIADSGFERQQRFLMEVGNYYNIYENYVREKVGKVSYTARMSQWKTRHTIDGRTVRFRTPVPGEYRGNMDDFPFFSEPEWSIMNSLSINLSNLAILLLWNIILFMAAHYAFVNRSLLHL
ncbi:ABC transporter permease subunit [Candidatus Poribacteria bacterium]